MLMGVVRDIITLLKDGIVSHVLYQSIMHIMMASKNCN